MIDHPSPRLRVASPPPSRGARHPPPGFHPRKLCLRGAWGRWALARSRHGDMLPTIWAVGNRPPRPNHPRKIAFSWGPVSRHPSIEGNLDHDGTGVAPPSVVRGNPDRDGNVPSSPPLEGWRLAAGVVRECGISHLVSCHSRAGGNRAWVVNNYLIWGIIQRCVLVIYL